MRHAVCQWCDGTGKEYPDIAKGKPAARVLCHVCTGAGTVPAADPDPFAELEDATLEARVATLDRRRAELEDASHRFTAAVTAYTEAVLADVRPLAADLLTQVDEEAIDLRLADAAASLRRSLGR